MITIHKTVKLSTFLLVLKNVNLHIISIMLLFSNHLMSTSHSINIGFRVWRFRKRPNTHTIFGKCTKYANNNGGMHDFALSTVSHLVIPGPGAYIHFVDAAIILGSKIQVPSLF